MNYRDIGFLMEGNRMSVEAKLKELGIELPPIPAPAGTYAHAVRTGNYLYLSGKGPSDPNGHGKVGADFTVEQAYEHARQIGLVHLSVVKDAIGSLDNVTKVVKVLGMVNAVPDFGDQPKVINGYSDLMVEVFGEVGRHARSAVGLGSLPNQITVEIEAIFEVAD